MSPGWWARQLVIVWQGVSWRAPLPKITWHRCVRICRWWLYDLGFRGAAQPAHHWDGVCAHMYCDLGFQGPALRASMCVGLCMWKNFVLGFQGTPLRGLFAQGYFDLGFHGAALQAHSCAYDYSRGVTMFSSSRAQDWGAALRARSWIGLRMRRHMILASMALRCEATV